MLSMAQTIQEHLLVSKFQATSMHSCNMTMPYLMLYLPFGLTEKLATFIMKEMERYIYGLKNVNMYFLSKPIFSIF